MEDKNRVWIAFANEQRCDHIGALNDLGYCDWACPNANLRVGDIVYLYVCNHRELPRQIRFKTVVEKIKNERTDTPYWKVPVSDKLTSRLRLIQEHNVQNLYELDLKLHGFTDFNARSIKLLNNPLLSYIETNF